MHRTSPFTLNDHSLITEKAGKVQNGVYTETGKSWLINPLLAHALLIKEEAALFFAPLPTDRQLKAVGHKLRDCTSLVKAVRQLINTSTCTVFSNDIEHLQGYNYLYYSQALQNRIIHFLEYHHAPLAQALLIFTMEKFQWERELYIYEQQQRARALLVSYPLQLLPPSLQQSHLLPNPPTQLH